MIGEGVPFPDVEVEGGVVEAFVDGIAKVDSRAMRRLCEGLVCGRGHEEEDDADDAHHRERRFDLEWVLTRPTMNGKTMR